MLCKHAAGSCRCQCRTHELLPIPMLPTLECLQQRSEIGDDNKLTMHQLALVLAEANGGGCTKTAHDFSPI